MPMDVSVSIKRLLTNIEQIQTDYQLVINNLEKKESFKVHLNEALLASSGSQSNNTITKDEKLKFKLGSNTPTTAPIRRSYSFR